MPNTLVHAGLQGAATRLVLRSVDLKWVYIGCILPDMGWMIQRAVRLLAPGCDPLRLRLYAIVLSTLAFSLLLAMALAQLSRRPVRTFFILAVNSGFHLLLDAAQIKWGNGVHFFAPLDWTLTQFGLFWPESPLNYILTLSGLLYLLINWRFCVRERPDVRLGSGPRLLRAALPLALYATLPLLLLHHPEKADNHYIHTLSEKDQRAGQRIELDRVAAYSDSDGVRLRLRTGERVYAEGITLAESAVVSIRGQFLAPDRIRVQQFHIHAGRWRSLASLLGLVLICAIWTESALRGWRRRGSGRIRAEE